MKVWNALMHAMFGNTTATPYQSWKKGNQWTKGNWRLIQIYRHLKENGGLTDFGGKKTVEEVMQWVLSVEPITSKSKDSERAGLSKLRQKILAVGAPDFEPPATKSAARKRRSSQISDEGSKVKKRNSEYNQRKRDKDDFYNRINVALNAILATLSSLDSRQVCYVIFSMQ